MGYDNALGGSGAHRIFGTDDLLPCGSEPINSDILVKRAPAYDTGLSYSITPVYEYAYFQAAA